MMQPRPSDARPRPPWMEELLADWRRRWPAAFTTPPVPLAVGASGQIKVALVADGTGYDRKTLGITFHVYTVQSSYLRALARGDMRRNLDGTEAGIPDEAARQTAQKLLSERAAKQAERRALEASERQVEVLPDDQI